MSRYAAFVFVLFFGVAFQMSHGIEVNVKDKGKLCLYANLALNFSVSYEVAGNKSSSVVIELPKSATSDGSKCDDTVSTLKLSFGEGHSWSVNFTIKDKSYQADVMTFAYNLSDLVFFPDSSANGTITVTAKPDITNVGLDTCYSCRSEETIQASAQVNMTLSDVLIQAFVVNGSKSENLTTCAADRPTTTPTTTPTPTPTTTPTTTPTPTPTTTPTNATTAAPAPNTTTTVVPPTTPTPTLPTPTTGNYSIKTSGVNGTVCLLANFGLKIGFQQNKKYQEVNFEPPAEASGTCGVNSSELVLASKDVTVQLTFTNDSAKFRLDAVNVTITTSSGVFVQTSNNLSLWEATLGSSYMCNKEQNFTITSLLSFYTFSLHVQPFGVKNGLYSTAEECFLDADLSFLVPIAVGVALSFLIILVLISYLIGRRKSRTGYQSV